MGAYHLGRSDNPKVYVERYGQRMFTVLNDTSSRQTGSLSIDFAPLHIDGSGVRTVDLKTNAEIRLAKCDRNGLHLSFSLEPISP